MDKHEIILRQRMLARDKQKIEADARDLAKKLNMFADCVARDMAPMDSGHTLAGLMADLIILHAGTTTATLMLKDVAETV